MLFFFVKFNALNQLVMKEGLVTILSPHRIQKCGNGVWIEESV